MTFIDYPGHFFALLLILLAAALTFVGFRATEFEAAGRRRYRPLLMALQVATVLLLLLVLWNPSRQRSTRVYASNEVLAVFDTSESMSVVEQKQQSRLDIALDRFTAHLHPDNPAGPKYRVYGFDSHVYHCGSPDLLRRWGTQTNLRNALTEISTLRAQRSGPQEGLAGIVIFTDGQPLDKNARSYPASAGEGLPVLLVGVGSRKPGVDVSVASLDAPARVWLQSTCTVTSEITSTNPSAGPVTIDLLYDGQRIAGRNLDEAQFAVNPSGPARAKVEFTIPAAELGAHVVTVQAAPGKDEITTANNSRATTIEVTQEERLKVLLYSQWASFDIGKIRQALAWNKRVDIDFGLDVVKDAGLSDPFQKAGGYARLPRNDEEYSQYDVILLGPCDLSRLTPEQLNGLYRFVTERGGGLMLLPGPAVTSLAAWQDERGNALLPVILKGGESRLPSPRPDAITLTFEAWAGRILDPNTFGSEKRLLSPYYDVAMVKPASTVLATIGDAPLIALQRLGRGRVCLLNAARLFQLYRENREGGPLTDLLAGLVAELGRTSTRGSGIDLFVERKTDNPQQAVFTARVLDKGLRPADGANVLLSMGQEVVTMRAAGQGRYAAELHIGPAQSVVARAQAEAGGIFLGERTVAVNLPAVQDEMSDVRLDEPFLRALATQIGAKYVYVDDLNDQAGAVFKSGRQVGTVQTIRSVWPNWLLLTTLCALLTVKWFLRRALGLM